MMISIAVAALTGLPSGLAVGAVLDDYLYLSSVSSSPRPVESSSGSSRIPEGVEMSDHYPGIPRGNQTLFQESELEGTSMSTVLIGNESSGYVAATLSTFVVGNQSMKELMEEELSEYPLRDPLSIAIPMTCIYMLILISGLVGNISTCAVIARTNYMHTATNYYLFR